MASVYFDPAVGGDGSTVTDDSSATTGLANGGHRTRFVPALSQVVAVAGSTVSSANNALAAANAAVNAPGTQANSVTSLTIGTGSKSLTLVQTGKSFFVGQYVQIVNNMTPTQWMVGAVTAFTSATGAMTVSVTATSGSGTVATWSISAAMPFITTPTFASLTVSNAGITGGAPANSGSAADPNSMSRFQAASVVLDFGAYANGDGWLQQRSGSNYATNYSLVLNPNGGSVGIGIQPVANNGVFQIGGHASVQALLEKATVTAGAPAATQAFDVLTQAVQLYANNAANNWTLNIRGNSTTTLTSIMQIGQSVTIAVLVTNGGTAYYPTALQIDGSAVTPKWQNGVAPTSGNASSVDAYTYTIVKTGAAAFTVLAAQVKYA